MWLGKGEGGGGYMICEALGLWGELNQVRGLEQGSGAVSSCAGAITSSSLIVLSCKMGFTRPLQKSCGC